MSKKTLGKINKALEDALAAELKEVAERDDEGKFKYSVVERMRVYDRALKLESIKLKLEDPEWGKEFG